MTSKFWLFKKIANSSQWLPPVTNWPKPVWLCTNSKVLFGWGRPRVGFDSSHINLRWVRFTSSYWLWLVMTATWLWLRRVWDRLLLHTHTVIISHIIQWAQNRSHGLILHASVSALFFELLWSLPPMKTSLLDVTAFQRQFCYPSSSASSKRQSSNPDWSQGLWENKLIKAALLFIQGQGQL